MATAFLVAAAALSAISSIKQGIDQRNAAKHKASLIEDETRIQANQKAQQLRLLLSEQQQRYAKSGVTLEGSPLLVMTDTRKQGVQEINDLVSFGFDKADVTRQEGRDAFVSGIISGAAKLGGAGYQLSGGAGEYDPNGATAKYQKKMLAQMKE